MYRIWWKLNGPHISLSTLILPVMFKYCVTNRCTTEKPKGKNSHRKQTSNDCAIHLVLVPQFKALILNPSLFIDPFENLMKILKLFLKKNMYTKTNKTFRVFTHC